MGTTDCRRHGFILVLVLFLTSISCLASKMDVNYDARGIKIEVVWEFSSKLGNQIPVCRHQNRSRAPVLMFDCKEKGYVFSKINFADYGHSSGDCGNFRRGTCGAPDTLRLVKKVRKINQH
ncbi:putative beta-galactosidase [Arabidopsis thaliana]